MFPWMKSATKSVLILLTLGLIYLVVLQIPVPTEYKELVLVVYAFYFGQKMTTSEPKKAE